MASLKKMVKRHNRKVDVAFDKAEKGEVINLTDLLISKENIHKKKYKLY